MNILFVRNYPTVDGVFTLLLRLAKHFKKDGHTVYFIDFGLQSDFQHEIISTFTLLTTKELKSKKDELHFDVIFPFVDGDLLCWCITVLKLKLFKSAKMVFGIYHPRAYFNSSYLNTSPDSRLNKFIYTQIPSQNILFMNEVVKRENEYYFKHKFQNSPIIPIPITLEYQKRNNERIDRRKIVSIGRLETFKSYVIPMIDTIQDLNNDGNYFEFYIYGHGSMESFLKNYIAEKKAGKYIFLMGKLEYKELFSVLVDAFMFVGMGTAIIEASAIGVPSLQAIDNEKGIMTYGFFDKLKGFSLGEVIPELPLVSMKTSIIELSIKNVAEYEQICEEHIIRANTFNINEVIKDYYSFFLNASNVFDFRMSNFVLITTKFLRQAFKLRQFVKPNLKIK